MAHAGECAGALGCLPVLEGVAATDGTRSVQRAGQHDDLIDPVAE
jgi:hypothetical protein